MKGPRILRRGYKHHGSGESCFKKYQLSQKIESIMYKLKRNLSFLIACTIISACSGVRYATFQETPDNELTEWFNDSEVIAIHFQDTVFRIRDFIYDQNSNNISGRTTKFEGIALYYYEETIKDNRGELTSNDKGGFNMKRNYSSYISNEYSGNIYPKDSISQVHLYVDEITGTHGEEILISLSDLQQIIRIENDRGNNTRTLAVVMLTTLIGLLVLAARSGVNS